MTAARRRSILAALAVLTVIGLLSQARDADRFRREMEATSFGKSHLGYGALFDLLTELQVPVSRSFALPADLPARATVWWLDPAELCADSDDPEDAAADPLRGWIEAGGTAVVFLGYAPCASVAGVALPQASGLVTAPQPAGEMGPEPAPTASVLEHDASVKITGTVVRRPRAMHAKHLATFEPPRDWQTVAAVGQRAFAIERPLGDGKIVLVADVSFLRNVALDGDDAAPLAIDFVRAYGTPVLDERAHGLRPNQSALVYLAGSAAWPLFVGLACLALLTSWRGSAVPPFVARAPRPAAPTIEAFVDSLATLYSRSRDFGRIASRYRELTAERLRRQFGLPAETSLAALVDRLRRDARVTPIALRALGDEERAVASEAELRAAVRLLDSIVPVKSTNE